MGVEYVSIGGRNTSYEYFASHKRRVEAAGLKIANMGDSSVHNMPQVTLGLAGRDEKIEEYKRYIRNIGKAGIHYTTYAHMGNGIWSSERETTRGGASARAFHQSTAKGHWAGEVFENPLSHGRKCFRWPKRLGCGSACIRTTPRSQSWLVFPGTCSAPLTAT